MVNISARFDEEMCITLRAFINISYYSASTKCFRDTKIWRKMQSSKDSTSPMSETCKIRAGQVKFQDCKPDWACKIVESKLKNYWAKQTRIPFF